jgi:hypothetical protein
VRAQISRHRGLVMCVALSHADMHSGMFLPVAPPEDAVPDDDPDAVVVPDEVVVPVVVPGAPMAPLVPVPNVGAVVLVDGSCRLDEDLPQPRSERLRGFFGP